MRVALTFDAEHPSRTGSRPDGAERILDVLGEARVRGTFFVQGRWASAYPAVARRIAEEGHLVGNHSNYHAPMTILSPEGIRMDVEEAERRIRDATGADPRPWFRCPFGDGGDRDDVVGALDALGYRHSPWHIDPHDWEEGSSKGALEGAIAAGLDASASEAVVLLHTWPSVTPDALPGILDRSRDRGASLVTLAELDHGA